ncbi:hypothetical protein [Mucilaginibacter pineti]|nr:hypothetical protein [Mucilaginibacter pineti]
MKTIISGAVATVIVAMGLTLNVQAKTLSHVIIKTAVTAVSDTGKMAKGKMKPAKMAKKKTAKKDKMKMDKMSQDTASKM